MIVDQITFKPLNNLKAIHHNNLTYIIVLSIGK